MIKKNFKDKSSELDRIHFIPIYTLEDLYKNLGFDSYLIDTNLAHGIAQAITPATFPKSSIKNSCLSYSSITKSILTRISFFKELENLIGNSLSEICGADWVQWIMILCEDFPSELICQSFEASLSLSQALPFSIRKKCRYITEFFPQRFRIARLKTVFRNLFVFSHLIKDVLIAVGSEDEIELKELLHRTHIAESSRSPDLPLFLKATLSAVETQKLDEMVLESCELVTTELLRRLISLENVKVNIDSFILALAGNVQETSDFMRLAEKAVARTDKKLAKALALVAFGQEKDE